MIHCSNPFIGFGSTWIETRAKAAVVCASSLAAGRACRSFALRCAHYTAGRIVIAALSDARSLADIEP
jgi:hypothetical protein